MKPLSRQFLLRQIFQESFAKQTVWIKQYEVTEVNVASNQLSHTDKQRQAVVDRERTQYPPLIGSSFHPWPGQVENRLFGFFAPAKKFASPDYTLSLSLSRSHPLSPRITHGRHRWQGRLMFPDETGLKMQRDVNVETTPWRWKRGRGCTEKFGSRGRRERVEGGWFRSVRLVFAARTQRARGQ